MTRLTKLGIFLHPQVLEQPPLSDLRDRARKQGLKQTAHRGLAVVSNVQSRLAAKTEIIWGEPNEEQRREIEGAFRLMDDRRMIQMDALMGGGLVHTCRLYVSSDYPHIALYWASLLKPFVFAATIHFTTISIPQWPRQHVYIFPPSKDPPAGPVIVLLGVDYVGEHKMSFLRQYLYQVKQDGMLGMHAASKVIRVREKSGKLAEKGVLILGLSGTGKTSLTVHDHGLEPPEGIAIRQDDITALSPDGRAFGTEENFYIKTEGLSPQNQPTLYDAVRSPQALVENVKLGRGGSLNFDDVSLTSNGRAIVQRRKIPNTDEGIDLERVDFIFFITRRFDILPPIVKLSPEWATLAFMLGESVQTSAGDVKHAGEAMRVVGMNRFIIGSRAQEGNRLLEILKKNPHIQCFLLNTGSVGGKEKITLQDSAHAMRSAIEGRVHWEKGTLGDNSVHCSL